MDVMIDTNIFLDFLMEREGADYAHALFDLVRAKRIKGWISSHSIPTIYYIIREIKTEEESRSLLRVILHGISIIPLRGHQIKRGYISKQKDYEDALIAEGAINHKLNFIITNNIDDYKNLDIPALRADEFLDLYKNQSLKENEKVSFVDLKAQRHQIYNEVDDEITNVVNNTNFILGDQVKEFETEFADFCGSKYCVGVASGTDALHLALRALNIGKGDEVITVANTFVATAFAISYTGATPVLVDIDPETYNIDLNKIEEKITPNTKAIIPVHLYGRSVDMGKLTFLANKYNVTIVEDACQAHGAIYKGKKVGSFGTMGCFSFYPGKNLGAYGDGGAIVTSDKKLYEHLKMLRNYGSPKKYYHDFIGYNNRLDTIQAAVLRVKLKYLKEWNKKRLTNAKLYNQKLNGVGDLILPGINGVGAHVFHLYVIRTKKRDDLLKYLNENGVQAAIHYPVPTYSLDAYTHLNLDKENFPVTEQISREILSLPMFPELREDQIDFVTVLIKKFYQNNKHD